MKNESTPETDWKLIGVNLANAGADNQADFLKSFIEEIYKLPSVYQSEIQLHAINSKLTNDEKEKLALICTIHKDQ